MEPWERLRLAREMRNIPTATAAAQRFGWNYFTYVQHENGERGLQRMVHKYAKALRVDAAWLSYGTGRGPAGFDDDSQPVELTTDELDEIDDDVAEIRRNMIQRRLSTKKLQRTK